jgi:hypothetical protein
MAINFLNTVDLNQNQLNKAAIQNLAANPASGVEGQIYFNTVAQTIKVYKEILPSTTPATYEWASISGDITEVQASAVNNKLGINVVDQLGPIPKVGLDIVGLTALGAPALDDSLAIYDKSTTTNKKLTVADIIGTSTWKLEGDGANPQTIVNGDTVDFVGDTYITATASSVSANNFKVNFDHDDTTRPANTTSTDSPGYSGTFTVIDSVTSNATGHVTAANELTITLPDDTNETYTLPTSTGETTTQPLSGKIELTAGGTGSGVKSTVNFVGTTNRIKVAGAAPTGTPGAGNITFDLTDDVTIVDDLNIGGIVTQSGASSTTALNSGALVASTALVLTTANTAIKAGMQVTGTGVPVDITILTVTNSYTFTLSGAITIANTTTLTFEEVNSFAAPLDMNNNRIHEVKTGVLGTDGVNLGQVQDLVAGIGLFKGGYDATTGLTTNLGAGNGSLDGASNIALDTGDFFVVTVKGSAFYTTALEVGDMIFANQTIAVDSDPAIGVYTVVIQDANIAGAGSTDAATEKGVAGFDSAYFDVSASGWVQLDSKRNPYGAKTVLDNGAQAGTPTSAVTRTTTGTPIDQTTFTIDVDSAFIFGTGALAANVKVEVLNNAAPLDTVYPCVERSGSGSIAIKFSGDVAVDLYQVLLSHI